MRLIKCCVARVRLRRFSRELNTSQLLPALQGGGWEGLALKFHLHLY